jgi:DNA invertase Pin-like site-specific DNA recombinase
MRLALYLRVSTDRQAERGQGLDVQEAACRSWAKRNGHRIVGVYSDEGVSGSNGVEDRDALPAALLALDAGEVDGILFARLDRLARALTVQEAILGRIWTAGGRAFSADDGEVLEDDPDDPMRTAMRQVRGVFAQLDRAMIAKRLRDGRRMKATKGGYAYGAPPFGVTSKDGQLVPVRNEAAAVRRIMELHRAGRSARSIAATLDAEGVPAKRGGRWYPMTVSRVIRRHGGRDALTLAAG